jgi:(1->4)-alpha-D-glucan 1-alpha-D-glucosylmutase
VQRAFLAVLPGVPESYVRSELTNVIVRLRGYRSYATGTALSPGPEKTLYQALLGTSVLAPIFSARDGNPEIIEALRKFHQLTAPVAAKAVEDTAFYRYGRLLSRNDVGFNPVQVFLNPNTFHDKMMARARDFPHSMLTTATHDHKRGEDARARLAVLSAKPAVWQDFLRQAPWPPQLHPADVYVLYQTLLGSWPPVLDESFALRVENWCRKHLREGKLRSNWFEPNLRYEDLLCSFSRQLILDNSEFVSRMTALIEFVKPEGDQNSIVQLVLKYTLPGVPDLYQGCEFSDFSLVDPDNRRPVDYRARSKEVNPALESPTSLDRRKQAAIVALLIARRRSPALWERGSYEPIPVAEGYLAFKRQLEEESICTLVRVHSGAFNTAFQIPFSGYDILTGRPVEPGDIVGSGLLRKDISWAMVIRNPT